MKREVAHAKPWRRVQLPDRTRHRFSGFFGAVISLTLRNADCRLFEWSRVVLRVRPCAAVDVVDWDLEAGARRRGFRAG